MMKTSALLIAVATVLTLSAHVHADDQDYNDGLKQDLNQDVEQMYPKRSKPAAGGTTTTTTKEVEIQTVKAPQVQAAPTQTVVQAVPAQVQPVYILQQPQSAPAAQVQPVTTVEDTPVKEPKIESLRKQREDVERQTEDKLMQKLEDDRVESEKNRVERLFTPPAPVVPVVAPVQEPRHAEVVAPAPSYTAVVVEPAQPTRVERDPEIVSSKVEANRDSEQPESSKFTVGALAGIGSYPTVSNISGSFAGGVALGIDLPNRLGLELDGVFSNYNIQNTTPCTFCGPGQSLVANLNQVNVTGGFNYFVLPGRVTPVIGVLAGYTRRSYNNTITLGSSQNGSTGSNAFDAGLNAGVDVAATDKLTISLDFRYMMNVSYRMDNALTYFGPFSSNIAPVEGLSYYFATLGLKLAL